MADRFSRRDALSAAGAAALSLAAAGSATAAPARSKSEPFTYCLNTSTLRGQKLSLPQEVDIAAIAGYSGIEPWINEIDQYVKGGASMKDLAARIKDRGLTVESAIAFPEWIVDDDARRARGLEEARRAMDLVRQIGGTRIAAPPVGATDREDMDLVKIAGRYRALCEIGDQAGVTPQVEVWGFSKTLSRLGSAAMVAIESGHPRACVLADIYHLHRGGSGFSGLRLVNGAAMHAFHVNDYPSEPAAAQLTDAHRVYPGDGAAPLNEIFRQLRDVGFRGALSLELFNKDYWQQDPLIVARTGLEKTRAAVRKALA